MLIQIWGSLYILSSSVGYLLKTTVYSIYDDIGDYVPDLQKRLNLSDGKREGDGNVLKKPNYFSNKNEPERDRYRVIYKLLRDQSKFLDSFGDFYS